MHGVDKENQVVIPRQECQKVAEGTVDYRRCGTTGVGANCGANCGATGVGDASARNNSAVHASADDALCHTRPVDGRQQTCAVHFPGPLHTRVRYYSRTPRARCSDGITAGGRDTGDSGGGDSGGGGGSSYNPAAMTEGGDACSGQSRRRMVLEFSPCQQTSSCSFIIFTGGVIGR